MDWDEIRAKPASRAIAVGEDLSVLSIAELEQRAETLKVEIVRVEAEVAAKRRHEAAASALFKSS